MKFVKIENRIMNLAEITHIEILESGAVKVFFSAGEPVRMEPPASQALVKLIGAPEITPTWSQ
jgi:hypothetical protein